MIGGLAGGLCWAGTLSGKSSTQGMEWRSHGEYLLPMFAVIGSFHFIETASLSLLDWMPLMDV
jgi:hypothetical protein